MKSRNQVSEAGVQLIMSFEGFRASAAALPDGRWTIGYGHTKSARAGITISEADGKILLLYDLVEISAAINGWIFTPLNQNQYDALICFAFNVGLENFRRSTVLRRVNEGALLQAACSFEMWRKAELQGERIIVDALVRRRAAEKALFLTPMDGWAPAPTPVVQPRLDHDVCGSVPKVKPVEVRTALVGDFATAELVPQVATLIEPAEPVAPGTRLEDASDAVSERLQAIMPEQAPIDAAQKARTDLDLPEAPAEAAHEAPVALFPATGFVEPAPEPEAAAPNPAPAAAPEAIDDTLNLFGRPAAEWSAEPFTRPTVVASLDETAEARGNFRTPAAARFSGFEVTEVQPARLNYLPYVFLGLLGVAMFGGAVFWAINARGGGGLGSPLIIGGIIALLGVAGVVASVYSLINHFLGREV